MNKETKLLLITFFFVVTILTSTQLVLADNEKIYALVGDSTAYSQDSNDQVQYHHKNSVAGTTITTNEQGEKVSQNTNYPYGKALSAESFKDSNNLKFSFSGKEQDYSQLHYFNQRYYDSNTLSFPTIDPVFDSSVTPYRYANNNPVAYVDPNGKSAVQAMRLGLGGYLSPDPITTGIAIISSIGLGLYYTNNWISQSGISLQAPTGIMGSDFDIIKKPYDYPKRPPTPETIVPPDALPEDLEEELLFGDTMYLLADETSYDLEDPKCRTWYLCISEKTARTLNHQMLIHNNDVSGEKIPTTNAIETLVYLLTEEYVLGTSSLSSANHFAGKIGVSSNKQLIVERMNARSPTVKIHRGPPGTGPFNEKLPTTNSVFRINPSLNKFVIHNAENGLLPAMYLPYAIDTADMPAFYDLLAGEGGYIPPSN